MALTLVRRDDSDAIGEIDRREVATQTLVDGKSGLSLAGVGPRVMPSCHLITVTHVEEGVRREESIRVPRLHRLFSHVGSVSETRVVEGRRGESRDVGVHAILNAV